MGSQNSEITFQPSAIWQCGMTQETEWKYRGGQQHRMIWTLLPVDCFRPSERLARRDGRCLCRLHVLCLCPVSSHSFYHKLSPLLCPFFLSKGQCSGRRHPRVIAQATEQKQLKGHHLPLCVSSLSFPKLFAVNRSIPFTVTSV